jgi:hypothetical protein
MYKSEAMTHDQYRLIKHRYNYMKNKKGYGRRFGTWNVRSLYRPGSLKIVSGELAKYKLDLVGVQEVRWDKGGTEPAGNYTFLEA